jgi:hypothetical protein
MNCRNHRWRNTQLHNAHNGLPILRCARCGLERDDIELTTIELEALLAAAGNVDPCMFTEDHGGEEGAALYDAWESGQEKLRQQLAKSRKTPRTDPPELAMPLKSKAIFPRG